MIANPLVIIKTAPDLTKPTPSTRATFFLVLSPGLSLLPRFYASCIILSFLWRDEVSKYFQRVKRFPAFAKFFSLIEGVRKSSFLLLFFFFFSYVLASSNSITDNGEAKFRFLTVDSSGSDVKVEDAAKTESVFWFWNVWRGEDNCIQTPYLNIFKSFEN